MERLSRILAFVLCCPSLAAGSWYVSTTGDDGNDGSIGTPFLTLEKARNVASSGDTIYLRGGTYTRTNTFSLASTNSGLTIRGYPGETAMVLGACPVSNWVAYAGSIVKADLSTQYWGSANIDQLFWNGTRQRVAREPDYDSNAPWSGGYLYIVPGAESTTQFYYGAGDLTKPYDATNAEAVVYLKENWYNQKRRISAWDDGTRLLTLNPALTRNVTTNGRYFVQRYFEALDAPGEWFLDQTNHVLYHYPEGSVTVANPVYAPAVGDLISVGSGASNITIRNLTLGYCTNRAVVLTSCTNVSVLANILLPVGDWSYPAIYVYQGASNSVSGNDIAYCGYDAIYVTGGVATNCNNPRHTIDNNWIRRVGELNRNGRGIGLYGPGSTASRNTITDCPRVGIHFAMGRSMVVESNYIVDTMLDTDDGGAIYAHSGSVGVDWISPRDSTIRGNFIKNASSFGFYYQKGVYTNGFEAFGIYLDGMSMGVDIIGNIIENASHCGVFINGGRDNRVYNNIIKDCDGEQIKIAQYGTNDSYWTTYITNAFNCYTQAMEHAEWSALRGMDVAPTDTWPSPDVNDAARTNGLTCGGNDIATNVVTFTNLTTVIPFESSVHLGYYGGGNEAILLSSNRWDFNSYYHAGLSFGTLFYLWDGDSYDAVNGTWAQWQGDGADANSSTNDPLLNADWTLDPASPALALGFQQISTNTIGCYYSSDRATWPLGQGGMRYLRAGTIRAGTLRGP
jgi:parallel beta-helix repeat protein